MLYSTLLEAAKHSFPTDSDFFLKDSLAQDKVVLEVATSYYPYRSLKKPIVTTYYGVASKIKNTIMVIETLVTTEGKLFVSDMEPMNPGNWRAFKRRIEARTDLTIKPNIKP